MVPTLIPINREGNPLRLSIQQNNSRAFAEVE